MSNPKISGLAGIPGRALTLCQPFFPIPQLRSVLILILFTVLPLGSLSYFFFVSFGQNQGLKSLANEPAICKLISPGEESDLFGFRQIQPPQTVPELAEGQPPQTAPELAEGQPPQTAPEALPKAAEGAFKGLSAADYSCWQIVGDLSLKRNHWLNLTALTIGSILLLALLVILSFSFFFVQRIIAPLRSLQVREGQLFDLHIEINGHSLKPLVATLNVIFAQLQTKQVHLEAQVEQRTLALQAVQGEMESHKARIESLLTARTDAIRAVVHDLNHTIQATQSALDLWVLELKDAEIDSELLQLGQERLQSTLEHQQMLLRDLRDAALLESGHLKLQPQETDLAALVQRVMTKLAARFELAECQPRFTPPATALPKVWCDAERIRRVLANILENALRYSCSFRDDGLVEIRLLQEGADLLCEISDNGLGIAPADLQQLGQKFVRVAQGEGRLEGSGLGLNFAMGVARLSGGSLVLASPGEGLGTTVTLRLPAVPLDRFVGMETLPYSYEHSP